MRFGWRRLVLLMLMGGVLVVQQLLVPVSLAEVSGDPFGLTPDKLRMFQGYQASSSAGSLFTGDGLKDNGLFSGVGAQLGGAAPLYGATVSNVNTAQFLVLTSHHDDMIITKVAGIPYNVLWDKAGGYNRYWAWDNEMHSYGIPEPDASRIALSWTRNWCNNPNASPPGAPTDPNDCGFDFTGVDPKESAGPYDNLCQVWGGSGSDGYTPDWKNHTGGPKVDCAAIIAADPTAIRSGLGTPTQCGTTALNAQTCSMADIKNYTYDQPKEGWKIPMTLTAKNVGTLDINGITLKAELQDHNGTVAFHAPTPPEPNPPFDSTSNINGAIIWTQINGSPFNLKPQQSQTFTWAVYPKKVNSVLRYTFTALFGSGESILLHWIPVYWPMQDNALPGLPGAGGGGGTVPGGGTPPAACGQSAPTSNIGQAIQQTFGITMNGGDVGNYDPEYLGYVWSEFCDLSKSSFMNMIKGSTITRVADGAVSNANGNCPGQPDTTLYLAEYKFGDNGDFFKFTLTHEFGHVIAKCTQAGQAAQAASGNARLTEGAVSWYGANAETYWNQSCIPAADRGGVTDTNEDFADSVAYFLNPWSTSYTEGPYSSLHYKCLPESAYSTNYPTPNPFYPDDKRPTHFSIMQQLFGG